VTAGDSSLVFDSSKTPGEILDLMVVNTEVLAEHPELGKALVGAWYETLALMQSGSAEGEAALTAMAEASGTDLDTFKSQLATTFMYWTPADAVAAVSAPELVEKMDLVRKFSFDKGLLGEGAESADTVGIAFPGDMVLGSADKVTMRFDPAYMQMAAAGEL
jgi:NitT/TauT family transport system substrate-binding protein